MELVVNVFLFVGNGGGGFLVIGDDAMEERDFVLGVDEENVGAQVFEVIVEGVENVVSCVGLFGRLGVIVGAFALGEKEMLFRSRSEDVGPVFVTWFFL